MDSLKIGVMGCSSFAQRAMIPAITSSKHLELKYLASRSKSKASDVALSNNCDLLIGYQSLIDKDDVDIIYMPLPTGLHEEWCTKALKSGKHVLVEKSFATDLTSAKKMVEVAQKNHCLIMENFQFQTHSQWKWIQGTISSGDLGDIHLVRSTFGFPPLPRDNFRWNKKLGGGALLDAGAYMTKISQLLLGNEISLIGASQTFDKSGVDLYGEAMFQNDKGQVAQVAFGFDYFYQCSVELLGTKGKLSTNRVFTAPPSHAPIMILEKQGERKEITLSPDNHYNGMVEWFASIVDSGDYDCHYESLIDQARLINDICTKAVTFTI